MPRKTSAGRGRSGRRAGFNEAAARCRGKRLIALHARVANGDASMRPRPDAAENTVRPRGATRRAIGRRFNEAAARCRGKPPIVVADERPVRAQASMRPRPDAAENLKFLRLASDPASPRLQ